MDSLTATAASGLRSRMEALDLLANNIANSATAGYKADQESYNLYFGDKAWDGYDEGRPNGAEMPVVQQAWTDFTQGTSLPTGSSTDLALSTPGFFVVDGPNGPLYTRNGHFRLNANGTLETQEGYKVKGVDGNPIKVTPGRDFHVSPSGQVQQDGATLSQVAVVNATDPNANERVGAGYFRFSPDAKVQPARNAQIAEGKIESSNTVPAYTAVKLVGVMRSFEMLQRAVNLASEMTKKSVEEVAHVTS